jgi:hypothetical protein
MLAAAFGTGRTRWRFGSDPGDANEPDDMGQLKTGQENDGLDEPLNTLSLYYSFTLPPAQSRRLLSGCILQKVCG